MNTDKKVVFYFITCIFNFAENFNLTIKDAYIYIKKYGGIQYLLENYEIEHTLVKKETLEALSCS